jgi:hypothetical protein
MPEKFKVEEVAPIIRNMLRKAKNSKALKHYAADVNNSSAIINACDLIEQVGKTVGLQ